jgi:hypothetical protein
MNKAIRYLSILLLLSIFAIGTAQTPYPTEKVARVRPPTADGTLILSKERTWSVTELNLAAVKYLWDSGSMSRTQEVQAIVHILAQDKTTMCEFLYVQGFEQHYWRVKIGYDGKVQGSEKRLKKEGH